MCVNGLFKEMSAFSDLREGRLPDDEYRELQVFLLKSPTAGAVISGTGGLRKLRWQQPGRGKGKRGGLRVVYYWYVEISQFWMFGVYGKDEATDLTKEQKKIFKQALERAKRLRLQ